MIGKRNNQLTVLVELAKQVELSTWRKLKENEYNKMLELLVKSCQYSLNRVRDKRKKAYYGLEHQFNSAYDMAKTLIGQDWFIKDWAICFLNYSNAGRVKKLSQRPTIGRINHDEGYLLGNIQVESFGYNASKAKSKNCTIILCNDYKKIAKTGTSYFKQFSCQSQESAIKTINRMIHHKTSSKDYSGKIETGLSAKIGDYTIFIQSARPIY